MTIRNPIFPVIHSPLLGPLTGRGGGGDTSVSLAAIMRAALNGGNGINVNWLADHVEIVEQGVDTSELVVDASASNWTPAGANVVEDEGSVVKIEYVDNATGASFSLSSGGLTGNLVANGRYLLEFEIRCENGSVSPAISGAQVADTMTAVSTSSFVSRTAYFISDGSEVLNIGGMAGTEIAYIRNISLTRIDRSHSGPIQDKITYTGTKKMVVHANGKLWWTAHNDYSTPAAPANQAITVVSGATYTIAVTGTTSITLSGAATGTVTAGNPISFTAATGTLTCGSTSGTGTAHLRRTPSDSTYVEDYGLPTEYDINTLDGSTTNTDIASSGEITFTLTGSTDYRTATTAHDDNSVSYSIGDRRNFDGMSFTARVDHTSSPANAPNADGTDNATWKRDDLFVRVSAADDVDGAWMLGRVKSQSGTTLTLEVLKSVGSGSYDDWHVIAVKGVVVEAAATNLVEHSGDLANATYWTLAGVGGYNTSTYVLTANASGSYARVVPTLADNTTYTWSGEVASGNLDWVYVAVRDKTNTVSTAYINTATGTVGTTTGSAIFRSSLGTEGFYVVEAVFNSASGGAAPTVQFQLASSGGSTTVTNGDTIRVRRPQLEAGSNRTSHIPTAGAAVERAADVSSMSLSGVPFNASAGTIYTDATSSSNSGMPIYINNKTINNSLYNIHSSSHQARGVVGTTIYQIDVGTSGDGSRHRIASAYAEDDVAMSLDGSAVGTDSDTGGSSFPISVDTIDFGHSRGLLYWLNGHLHQTIITLTRETNAELQARSA